MAISETAAQGVDRRNDLAVDRTLLAAERTYAAWLRTGLAALASGVGAHSLLAGVETERLDRIASTVLILCGVTCFAAGVWRELLAVSVWPKSDIPRMSRAILVLASASLTVVSLAVLVGIWLRQ
jgi:putative membrane protein